LALCFALLSHTTEQYAYGTIEIQNASLLSSINADSQLAYFSGGGTGGTSNMGNTTGKSTTGTSNRNGTTGGSGNPNQGGARSTNSGASASNAGGGTGDADKTGSGAGSTRGGDNNPGARGPAGAGGTGPGGSGGVRSTNSPSNPNTNTKSPGTGGNGVQSNGNNTTDPDKQTPGGGSTRGGDTDPANQGAAQARADAVSKAQTQQKTTEKQTALGNLTRSLTQRFSPPSNFQTPATTPTRSITPAKSLTDALKQPYNMGDTAVKAVAEKVATEARIAAAERTEALAKSLTKSATPTSIPSYQSYREDALAETIEQRAIDNVLAALEREGKVPHVVDVSTGRNYITVTASPPTTANIVDINNLPQATKDMIARLDAARAKTPTTVTGPGKTNLPSPQQVADGKTDLPTKQTPTTQPTKTFADLAKPKDEPKQPSVPTPTPKPAVTKPSVTKTAEAPVAKPVAKNPVEKAIQGVADVSKKAVQAVKNVVTAVVTPAVPKPTPKPDVPKTVPAKDQVVVTPVSAPPDGTTERPTKKSQQPSSPSDSGGGGAKDSVKQFMNPETARTLAQLKSDEAKLVDRAKALQDELGGLISLPDAIVAASEITRTIIGEAGQEHEKKDQVAVANAILNRIKLAIANEANPRVTIHGALNAFDANMQRKNTPDSQNYATADIGTPGYDEASEALDAVLAGELGDMPKEVENATHYTTPEADPEWEQGVQTTQYGPHEFSNPDAGRSAEAVEAAKAKIAKGEIDKPVIYYDGPDEKLTKEVARANAVAAKAVVVAEKLKPRDQLAVNPKSKLEQVVTEAKPQPKNPPVKAPDNNKVTITPAGFGAPDGVEVENTPATEASPGTKPRSVALAPIEDITQKKTRNKPARKDLIQEIREDVARVYGPGYKVTIVSAGQKPAPRNPVTGEPISCKTGKCSGRTKSDTTRHDIDKKTGEASAADVNITAPDGTTLEGDALAPLAQEWQSKGRGSTGYYGDGMLHLDFIGGEKGRALVGSEGLSWDWTMERDSNNRPIPGTGSAKFAKAVANGQNGIAPEYKGEEGSVAGLQIARPTLGKKLVTVGAEPEELVVPGDKTKPAEELKKQAEDVAETITEASEPQSPQEVVENLSLEEAKEVVNDSVSNAVQPTDLKKALDGVAAGLNKDGLSIEDARAGLETAFNEIQKAGAVESVSFEEYDEKRKDSYTYDITIPAGAIDDKYVDAFVKDLKERAQIKAKLWWAGDTSTREVKMGVIVDKSVLTKPAPVQVADITDAVPSIKDPVTTGTNPPAPVVTDGKPDVTPPQPDVPAPPKVDEPSVVKKVVDVVKKTVKTVTSWFDFTDGGNNTEVPKNPFPTTSTSTSRTK